MHDAEKLLFDFKSIKPGTKILVRADLNLSLNGNHLEQSLRITRTIPLIRRLLRAKAHVTVVTHLGRPGIGFNDIFSTRQLVTALEQAYRTRVVFNQDWPFCKKLDVTEALVLAENVRFLQGEKTNNPILAREMAAGYDLCIMEAFATAHRKHASNYGILEHVPTYIGPLFLDELRSLEKIKQFKSPKIAVIGGGKSSSKLQFVEKLVQDFNAVLLGGQMANLFMASAGYFVGEAEFDPILMQEAKAIYEMSKQPNAADIIFPKDFWVSRADRLSLKTTPMTRAEGAAIVDIGPLTTSHYGRLIKEAKSVLQNGPMGIIENSRCFEGTRAILQEISESSAVSVLGGGDTGESVRRAGIDMDQYDFISTGGGAMLYGVCNDNFPCIEKLKASLCAE